MIKLKIVILILFVSCVFSHSCFAQNKSKTNLQSEVQLDDQRQTVYITYERAGKLESLYADESDQRIWFKLHNNTRWAISFASGAVPKAFGDTGINYEVEAIRPQEKDQVQVPLGRPLKHVYSPFKLSSGRSILFSVAREHIAKGLALRISFNYEWEDTDRVSEGREPRHYVYFYSTYLPETVIQP